MLAEAGTTRGALYFHFASKQLLLDAVESEATERVARALDDTSDGWIHALRGDPVVRASLRVCVADVQPIKCVSPLLASGVAWGFVAQAISEFVISPYE